MNTRVVNLRNFRKRKAREDAKLAGDQNSAKFGERAVLRRDREVENEKRERDLDGHRREDPDSD